MLFYIFRHGETDGNARNIVQGAGIDLPLNEKGRKQAEALGKIFSRLAFPVIYSSKMTRAQETARIVASFSRAKVIPMDGLEEIHYGEAEGMLSSDIHVKYKDILDIIQNEKNPSCYEARLPGGENVRESVERTVKALEYIKEHADSDRVAVATHGALMHNIYEHYFGLRRSFANCEYFVVEI